MLTTQVNMAWGNDPHVIRIECDSLMAATLAESDRMYEEDANALFQALSKLPGGTYDRLFALMCKDHKQQSNAELPF